MNFRAIFCNKVFKKGFQGFLQVQIVKYLSKETVFAYSLRLINSEMSIKIHVSSVCLVSMG